MLAISNYLAFTFLFSFTILFMREEGKAESSAREFSLEQVARYLYIYDLILLISFFLLCAHTSTLHPTAAVRRLTYNLHSRRQLTI
jgi:hypothetical protein